MNEIKNKNLFIRVSEKEKNLIERNAERCGLTVSEYLRQRALGYMPRAVLPEVFFSFNDKLDALCMVCEGKISVDTEEKIIALIDEITAELIFRKRKGWCNRGPHKACFVGRRSIHEMASFRRLRQKRRMECDATWLLRASGL